jgi:hypothetical protein
MRQVEILTFAGCPNVQEAVDLVTGVATELGTEVDIRLVDVPDAAAAERLRFLGSPTVRVDGRDVEPGADARREHVLACRVYPSGIGVGCCPDRRWVETALRGE